MVKGVSKSRGAVYIEAAIVLPVLVFLGASIINLGLLFSDYVFLSQLNREVALRGARTAYMSSYGNSQYVCTNSPSAVAAESCASYSEEGPGIVYQPVPGEEEPAEELPGVPNAAACGHIQLCYYANQLAATKNLFLASPPQIKTKLTAHPEQSGVCMLTVEVDANYRGILSFYRDVPITIYSQTGYLSAPYTC